MTLSITQGIKSVTELKRNTNAIIDQLHKTRRPVVLTVNGRAQAVLLDAQEYENITGAFDTLKSLIADNGLDGETRQKLKDALEAVTGNNSI